jgi:hypothetical protein
MGSERYLALAYNIYEMGITVKPFTVAILMLAGAFLFSPAFQWVQAGLIRPLGLTHFFEQLSGLPVAITKREWVSKGNQQH